MTNINNIRQLYALPRNKDFGYSEEEIKRAADNLNITFPLALKQYYLALGKVQSINTSHNILLNPLQEVGFSDDRYLVFYEENQNVAFWGIKEEDLKEDNPAVWGNYGTNEHPDWCLEANTTEDFLLLMSIYNGTLGGLKYNANYFGFVDAVVVHYIEKNWSLLPTISGEKQKVYTNDYQEIISISFDAQSNADALFVGTSKQDRFDKIIESINVAWSYTSYDDEEE